MLWCEKIDNLIQWPHLEFVWSIYDSFWIMGLFVGNFLRKKIRKKNFCVNLPWNSIATTVNKLSGKSCISKCSSIFKENGSNVSASKLHPNTSCASFHVAYKPCSKISWALLGYSHPVGFFSPVLITTSQTLNWNMKYMRDP